MSQIRGLFPLPLTSPANTGTPNVLMLNPGGIWYPPPGEYLLNLGGQTCIQIWDQTDAIWRSYVPPGSIVQQSMDGTNYRLINLSGVCVGANISNAGSSGTNGIGPVQTGTTVTFGAPAAGGATATAQGYAVVGGSVPAPTVTQGGSGFLVPPVIACDPPPNGGVQATFTSTISSAGVLTGVTQVFGGAGYTSVPNFYIIPQFEFYPGALRFPGDVAGTTIPNTAYPPGLINPANVWPGSPYQGNIASGTAGALLTGVALTGSGTLTAIVMTYFGNGYAGNTVPSVSFTGGGLAGGVAATAIMSFCASAAIGGTVTATGGTAAVVNDAAISTLGVIATVNNNNTFFPKPIRGIISSTAGAFTLEDPGFGLQGGAVFVSGAGTTAITITNTQYGGRNDTTIVQAMSQ